jgi:hypothetical protein
VAAPDAFLHRHRAVNHGHPQAGGHDLDEVGFARPPGVQRGALHCICGCPQATGEVMDLAQQAPGPSEAGIVIDLAEEGRRPLGLLPDLISWRALPAVDESRQRAVENDLPPEALILRGRDQLEAGTICRGASGSCRGQGDGRGPWPDIQYGGSSRGCG